MNAPSWLSLPWAERVDWPEPLRMLRGVLGADRVSFTAGIVMLLPRDGALPVVGHVNKAAALDIIDSPEGCAMTWMRIYTLGHPREFALVPAGAVLSYVDPRCLSEPFLSRPFPARWNHLGRLSYAEFAPSLTGLPNGDMVLENEPPPLPSTAAPGAAPPAPPAPAAPSPPPGAGAAEPPEGKAKPEGKGKGKKKDDGQLGFF